MKAKPEQTKEIETSISLLASSFNNMDATQNALHYKVDQSFSDGNMVVGNGDKQTAIAFNNTAHNQNSLVLLEDKDVVILHTLLTSAMKAKGLLV